MASVQNVVMSLVVFMLCHVAVIQSKPVTKWWQDAHNALLGVKTDAENVFKVMCNEEKHKFNPHTCEGYASIELIHKSDAIFHLPRRLDLTIDVGDSTNADTTNQESLSDMKHSLHRFKYSLGKAIRLEKKNYCQLHHGSDECPDQCTDGNESTVQCGLIRLRSNVENAEFQILQTMRKVWGQAPTSSNHNTDSFRDNTELIERGHRLGFTFGTVYLVSVEAESFLDHVANLMSMSS